MSIRTFPVQASHTIEIDGENFDVVTEDDLTSALARAAIVLNISGGMLAVVTQRKAVPSIPNYYVTTAAIVEWRDRTNAKPQAEGDDGPLGAAQPVLSAVPEPSLPPDDGEPEQVAGSPVLPFADPERPDESATRAAQQPAEPAPAPPLAVVVAGDVPAGELVGDGLDAVHLSNAVDESALRD